LHPDLTQGKNDSNFSGNITIHFSTLKQTDEIVLHSHELNIESVEMNDDEGNSRVLVNSKKKKYYEK
jgi:aminopeptidase N